MGRVWETLTKRRKTYREAVNPESSLQSGVFVEGIEGLKFVGEGVSLQKILNKTK